MKNSLANKYIKEKIRVALNEDFGASGDITSKTLISKKSTLKASIYVKESAILCGTEFAYQTFKMLDNSIKIKMLKEDGSKVIKGDKIITVSGSAESILAAERTALNFLGLMSGIASKTRKYVDIAKTYGVKIYSTRKTIPGIREMQKYALTVGGAYVNRSSLSDFYFIKDNHLSDEDNLIDKIKKIRRSKLKKKITVEVDTIKQLQEILDQKIDIVLLDNMTEKEILRCLKMVDNRFLCEASGNINLKNLKSYAKTRVNRISTGQITHSIENIDFGLEI